MQRVGFLVAISSIAFIAGAPRPQIARADDDTPATTQASASADALVKHGTLYVLPSDSDVTTGMRAVRAARKKVDDETKARAAIEAKITQAKNYLSQADFQERKLNEQLTGVRDATANNRIVGQINVLRSKMREAETFKEDQETKLKAMSDDNRTAYINSVVDLSAKAEKTKADYAELASDAEVKAKLESTKPKAHLGPTPEFTAAAAQLKKWRGDISSDVVAVTVESGVPNVEVTVNGKFTRTMVFDSGAALVTLPADVAASFGLTPGPKDEIVHLKIADGKIIEAHLMTLESVRVGTFTIQDVECAVLPADLVAAQPLLGGTFLHNFVYKLDIDAGKLHLAQVGAPATIKKVNGTDAKAGKDPTDKKSN